MNAGSLVKASFYTMIITTIVGAYLKIFHANAADTCLIVALLATLAFIVTALYEVNASRAINGREKVLWTIGLIVISGIAGLIYFIIGRRKVVGNYK